ncbi:extracellular signal-regulated kinase 1/2 [Angomonas deanei]|nr:extracellular signal-regulated kinase 1/2 [Angomonas deanei]EPY37712.1 extracellular signal-regulated kinase 1/2 [Angomonas deanei]|eukprot:EPY32325.1 extracellular signal-regulated kinase 1/2 [Angomonas deanei]
MEIMTTLDHTNIVKLKHFIRPQNKETFQDIYFVMDLYDTDLHRIIKSGQKLTNEHHQYFMIQAFRGLNYLHSAKIMHRDLKPSNLLVNADCALAICDFGLARDDQVAPTAELTQYVVTRWYRPPELLDTGSNMYSSAIDVWSLGLIFAELMVGKALLPGSDYISQLNMVVNLLGTPSVEDMEFLSSDAKTFLQNQPFRKGRPFTSIFPMATPEAADLLSKLLVFHPAKRLTAKQVIEHPYFHKFRDPKEEGTSERPFVWTHLSNTPEALREEFWTLILKHSDE